MEIREKDRRDRDDKKEGVEKRRRGMKKEEGGEGKRRKTQLR